MVCLPAQLRQPTRYRNPGVGDGRLALARRGTILVGGAKSATLVETLARGAWYEEAAARARATARRVVSRHVGRWSVRSAAIVVAILIGDRAGLDEDVERRLQEAGTYHVIAISGGNIAILAALVLGGLRLLGAGHRVSAAVGIAILCAYAFVVGGGGSVVRATLMAVLLLAAGAGDYRTAPLNALAVAGGAVLAAAPLSLFDVGCALTFGATLGILAGASLVLAKLPGHRCLRWPLALLAASVCAELALFPISAFAFSRVTFAGLILNFAAIPLMTVVQVAGMLVLPLAALHSGAASAAGWVAHAAAEGLTGSATLVDWWPWLSYRLPPPHPVVLVTYYSGWAAWFALARRRRPSILSRSPQSTSQPIRQINHPINTSRHQQMTMIAIIVAGGLWILIEPVTLVAPGVRGMLRVTFLDVGHADAVLVQLPDRRSVLVDTGGSLTGSSFDMGGRVLAPALWSLGTRLLDVVVLSHGDPDHIGGAASVIRDFRPREIWEGVVVPPNERLGSLRRQAERAGAAWRTCLQGERGTFGDVSWRVWHPLPPDWERQHVRNDDSIVLELRYREVSVLLPGDIGRPVEQELSALIPPAPLRILKVPHHGSVSSSTAAFISALRPRVAVLSAGATTKVADVVLARYQDAGASLYRTDRDGAVIVTTDGHTATVQTFTGVTAAFGPG
jgi:competence protein ComEC